MPVAARGAWRYTRGAGMKRSRRAACPCATRVQQRMHVPRARAALRLPWGCARHAPAGFCSKPHPTHSRRALLPPAPPLRPDSHPDSHPDTSPSFRRTRTLQALCASNACTQTHMHTNTHAHTCQALHAMYTSCVYSALVNHVSRLVMSTPATTWSWISPLQPLTQAHRAVLAQPRWQECCASVAGCPHNKEKGSSVLCTSRKRSRMAWAHYEMWKGAPHNWKKGSSVLCASRKRSQMACAHRKCGRVPCLLREHPYPTYWQQLQGLISALAACASRATWAGGWAVACVASAAQQRYSWGRARAWSGTNAVQPHAHNPCAGQGLCLPRDGHHAAQAQTHSPCASTVQPMGARTHTHTHTCARESRTTHT